MTPPKPIDPCWLTDDVMRHLMRHIEVESVSGCCLWRRARSVAGYGVAAIPGRTCLGQFKVHRLMWVWANGRDFPIDRPDADHLCRVRACCRPDHLEPVTQWENTLRTPDNPVGLNPGKRRCPRGHRYDYMTAAHGRSCRRCDADLSRRRSHKRFAVMGQARRELGLNWPQYQALYGQSGERAQLLLDLLSGEALAVVS